MGKSKQKSKISVGKITNRSALLAIVGSWRYPGSFNQQVNELKKVSWPSRAETIRLTTIVIIVSLIIGLYVGIIDVLLAKGLEVITKFR